VAKLNETDARWVDQTLGRLSLREKLGQILIPRLTRRGCEPLSVADFVHKYKIGGGHVFGGSLGETRQLVREAQEASEIPLLISGDLERGTAPRIAEGTEYAGQLALGACGDRKLAYRFGTAIAVEGLAAGFNWVFGPVVDLSLNPNNLSHIRCLGSDPKTVSALAVQIIRGIQDHGMAACAKHFPGAGTADLDSHLTTAANHLSKRQWQRLSAVPFRAAIQAGVLSVMASPKACPAIDPECGDKLFPRPVMTSRAALQGVLRGKLGFDGLIVTDAVTMGGLTMHFRRLEMLLACLKAGNDMLLFVRRLDSVLDYLERCVKDGDLKERQIDESARRVLELKAAIGLHLKPRLPSEEDCREAFTGTPFGRDAELLAEKSITLLRDRARVVPLRLKPGAHILSVLITNRPEFDLKVFEGVLQEAGCRVTSAKNPEQETLYDRLEAGEFDALVVSLYYPPQWGWSTPRCHGPEARCLMDGFPFANPRVPAVFISWSNPYHLYEFAFMDPYINTYGGAPGTQRAAARALVGRIPIVGKSPVAQPPFFKLGAGLRRRALRK